MTIPDIVTLTDIKQRPAEIFEQVRIAPVVVTHRGDTAGVFASVALWNQREAELARLRRIIAADQVEQRADFVEFADADPN